MLLQPNPHSSQPPNAMTTTIPHTTTAFLRRITAAHPSPNPPQPPPLARRRIITTLLTSLALATPPALAQNWGTRSFLKERFFEPDLSPEDAAARIRQTAEGLHFLRPMLETMSWRYVIFYIRLKQAYLSKDMTIAMSVVPEFRRRSYVQAANELVDNMRELDRYVRSPKVYESYLYYEKTLKSIDDLVAFLA